MGADLASIWIMGIDGDGAQELLPDGAQGQTSLGRGPSLDWAG